jgi:hypothetical protein
MLHIHPLEDFSMKIRYHAKILLAVIVIIVMVSLTYSQPPEIEWSRTYGDNGIDQANCVCAASDGGYIFTGYTKSFGADSNDVYLVKTDNQGNQDWFRLYGGSGYDDARSIQQTADGGYILAGRSTSFGLGDNDIYAVKTDSNGDTLWSRTYGGTDTDIAESVVQTNDEGYAIAGYTRNQTSNLWQMYLMKTNIIGDTLWIRSYEAPGNRAAYSVDQTIGGGYIICGWNPFGSGSESDIYLIRTDVLGNVLWTTSYGGDGEEAAFDVHQTMDGGFIIAGWTDSFGAGYGDFYLVKTDSVGDTLWTNTYGGTDGEGAYSVKETSDGGYVLAGVTYSFGAQNGDMYLVRTNPQGDTLWTLSYGGPDAEYGYSIDLTSDGGYIIAGAVSGEWDTDALLVKTGPDTSATHAPSIEWVSHPLDFALHPAYPNPFNPTTTISFDLPLQSKVSMNIYNILGQRVAVLMNGYALPGTHRLLWDASDLPSGIYFVRMESGKSMQTQKVVLLK